jgi:hypothetical protein
LSYDNSTAEYKFLKKPYTLAGFEPGIFCSVGGRGDHYSTPPAVRVGVEVVVEVEVEVGVEVGVRNK